MKKVLLSASLVAATFMASYAQISAGTIAIGGTLGFSTSGGKTKVKSNGTTTSTDKPKTTSFSILPNVSYFLSDKLALGLALGYNGSTTSKYDGTNNVNLKTKDGLFVVNPYAKYYIGLGEKTYFLLQGELALGFGSSKGQRFDNASNSVVDDNPTKRTIVGLGVLPGILFTPSEKIGLELMLGTPAAYPDYNGGGAYLLGFSSKIDKSKDTNPETTDIENTFSFFNLNAIGARVSVYYFIK